MVKSFIDFINESFIDIDDIEELDDLKPRMFCKYLNYIYSIGQYHHGRSNEEIFRVHTHIGLIEAHFKGVIYTFLFHRVDDDRNDMFIVDDSEGKHAEKILEELKDEYNFRRLSKDIHGNDIPDENGAFIKITPINDEPVTNSSFVDFIDAFFETEYGRNKRTYIRRDTDASPAPKDYRPIGFNHDYKDSSPSHKEYRPIGFNNYN